MNGFVKVAAAAPKVTVADTRANAEEIIRLIEQAKKEGVRLVVFPELCITGYTAGDLFLQQTLLSAAQKALEEVAAHAVDITAVVGLPVSFNGKLYNVAAVLSEGKVVGAAAKTHLPNYCEFYEARNFTSGEGLEYIKLCGETVPCGNDLVFEDKDDELLTFGVEICEDAWVAHSPAIELALGGARIICNPSASVEVVGKAEFRRTLLKGHSAKLIAGYIYADCGSGESTTDSVFSGHRLIAEDGAIIEESELFGEGLTITDIDLQKLDFSRRQTSTFAAETEGVRKIKVKCGDGNSALSRKFSPTPFVSDCDEGRAELIMKMQSVGLKRRMESSGCKKLVLGISGGLDSALALLVALRAAEKPKDVVAITMPCFGSSEKTKRNAGQLCEALKVTFREIPIENSVRTHFEEIGHDENDRNVVYENAQARERTQVLMDVANGIGALVVGTGDMSELALGWCTYGGDHMSSYGVNASIPKTLVRRLVLCAAKRLGGKAEKVLSSIASTAISPELLPPKEGEIAQKTEDILGKYEYHDFFLYYGLRWGFEPKKVMYLALNAFGSDKKAEIKAAMQLFYRRFFSQQFKRSCMPDGAKVGTVSLSPRSDLRMPSDASARLWLEQIDKL